MSDAGRPRTAGDAHGLVDLYLATEVSICLDGTWCSAADAVTYLGGPIDVITAWNPGYERPGRPVNEQANERLRRDLAAITMELWVAVGRDPRSDHMEELGSGRSRSVGSALARSALPAGRHLRTNCRRAVGAIRRRCRCQPSI